MCYFPTPPPLLTICMERLLMSDAKGYLNITKEQFLMLSPQHPPPPVFLLYIVSWGKDLWCKDNNVLFEYNYRRRKDITKQIMI